MTEIVELNEKHLQDAAAMVTSAYRAEGRRVPSLPPRYEQVEEVLKPLAHLAGKARGVAAINRGRLAGFLLGMVIGEFRGKRAAYAPEYAHAVRGSRRVRLYQRMYAKLARRWLADGCCVHVITLPAHDRQGIDTWFRLGFGMTGGDAMRDLSAVEGSAPDAQIRRATAADVEAAMALNDALRQHMAAPPTFLLTSDEKDRDSHARWLADPAKALWLAYRGGEPVSCIGIGPANRSAAYVIRDPGTASILRAFTRPDVRGRGLGTALLGCAIDWARLAGYERCAVDYEPQNPPGASFWLRHFEPVCYSLMRYVDERITQRTSAAREAQA
ncbi:MAG TPA: GNAT family N-acetyltransferase [Phycisphaerae bacterium]|nr:GNAT family N-acetyltransferase [Phycisphaerae bacterium]